MMRIEPIISIAWLLIIAVSGTFGAGVSVHLTVLERNKAFIPDDLADHMHYARAGAFFPDAFYSCLGFSELAEDTHWPPFMKIAVEHWKEKYVQRETASKDIDKNYLANQLWTLVRSSKLKYLVPFKTFTDLDRAYIWDKEKELRAFLYGVMSHQVSDVSWHSLGISQGLLEYMAAREFAGDTSAAHELLDIGGDMIFVNRLLSSGLPYSYLQQDWDYPREDLIEIMKKAGYAVSPSQLDYCMVRGRAALKGERQIAKSVYSSYAEQSPILFNELETYFLGGMTELTTSIRHCTYRLNDWFTGQIPNDPWSLCFIFQGKIPRNTTTETHLPQLILHANGEDEQVKVQEEEEEEMVSAMIDRFSLTHPLTESARPPDDWLKKEDKAPLIIATGIPQTDFGQSLSIGYFLGRGILSLAVGAPLESITETLSKEDIPQGNVYVASLKDLLDDMDLLTRTLSLENSVQSQNRQQQTSGAQVTSRFGQSSCLFKVVGKDILAVNAPGESSVSFFFKGTELLRAVFSKATSRYGVKGLKLVGMEILAADVNGDGYNEVVVSAPYADVDGHNQKGRVYVLGGRKLATLLGMALYANNGKDKRFLPLEVDIDDILEEVIDLPGKGEDGDPQSYALFGSRLAAVDGLLVIGAVGQAKVYGFKHDPLTRTYKQHFVLQAHLQHYQKKHSAFGGSLLAISPNGWIAIGDSTHSTDRLQAGAVYLYRLDKKSQPQLEALVDFGQNEGDGLDRFGHNGIFVDNELYVVSPYGQRERGKLWRINIEDKRPHGIAPPVETLVHEGPYPYANGYGTSIAGVKHEGSTIIVVGMPFFNSTQGAVAIYEF